MGIDESDIEAFLRDQLQVDLEEVIEQTIIYSIDELDFSNQNLVLWPDHLQAPEV